MFIEYVGIQIEPNQQQFTTNSTKVIIRTTNITITLLDQRWHLNNTLFDVQ